jgi:tetratricopeptide (TPR) repeat protein
MGELRLEVREFESLTRWRWLLTEEATGRPLADHPVDLTGPSDEYAAFTDLYRYLRWNAVPDRRTASEAEIVARAGAWAGREVLGEAIGQAIIEAAPVTVRVMFPPEAGFLLSWPLELAHAAGKPLAARGDVTWVYDLAVRPSGQGGDAGPGAAGRLRMLAVFSQPTSTSVLALRRERYELARLIRRIGARERRRVELTLLQYGVTRERLARIVDSGDGWDVLHLSGHGARGLVLLEKADGSPDPVDTGDLVDMLGPLRRRVKLAVVSACESAAATTAETLRWVGLTNQAEQLEQQADPAPAGPGQEGDQVGPPEQVITGIARALVTELGCAVVAMRYPVTDDFATAFTEDLYERLMGRGQQLGTALARAVPEAAGPQATPARPAISLATPMLFGAHAAGLTLEAPQGQPVLDTALLRMERFPREPERFVGRAQAMAQASAVLAASSGRTGVLLHGMAGSGKTACALELAYRHQDSFEAVAFWQAPELADQFAAGLAGLAAALDIQLGGYGFAMSDKITTLESLEVFLPRLRLLLEDNGILLVLDNLETLLTGSGGWRDPRWEPLITALTGHRGESRVILTSRMPPAGLGTSVLILPVHALSLDKSAALARELPSLRRLLHADAGPLRDAGGTTVAQDRDLVRRVLHVVQGHPNLMELADAAAADPGQLAAQLNAAGVTADGQVLDAFFRDGTTSLDAAQFLDALTTWTIATLAALPEPARLMVQFLACLEDNDRRSEIVDGNWADLWRRLDTPGGAPGWEPLVAVLTAAALIQDDQPAEQDDGEDPVVFYRMHPGVTQAIRATLGPAIQDATDAELAAFWSTLARQAMNQEGGEHSQMIVTAGLRAAPYLLRLRDWQTAGMLLERTLHRDASPSIIQAALPSLRAIADATGATADLGILAMAVQQVDPAEAERLLRAALDQTVSDGDFRSASAATGNLAEILRDMGRLEEALDLTGQGAEYTRRAGLGPWTQLVNEGRRLQILGFMGRHREVLDEIGGLQARMDELPSQAGPNDPVRPWNVREVILDVGHFSAGALGDWQQALDFNQAGLASKRARNVSDYEFAYAAYNNVGPLVNLGRLDDAERLMADCQQVFEDHDDLDQLGNVFAARAALEDERGRLAGALAFQKTAIRYAYLQREPRDVAISHHNLANYLWKADSDPAAQRAHRLAAALIYQLTGMTHELFQTGSELASEFPKAASSICREPLNRSSRSRRRPRESASAS